MTIVNKLVMRGFKSFAKRTEIPFSGGFNTVIGPNGSGKSIDYNMVVILKDGTEVKIGELIEEQLKKNLNKTIKDGVYCESEELIEVFSINPISMKHETKRVSKFIRHKGEELFYIRTSLGKELKATGCHPIIVFRDGKLKSSLISDIKEGELIAAPRKIDVENIDIQNEKPGNISQLFDLKVIKKDYLSNELARFFGYIIGDGHIHLGGPRFTNSDKEIVEDFEKCTKFIFNLNPKRYKYENDSAYEVVIHSRRLSKDLEKILGGRKSDKKQVPSIILSSSKEVISHFIGALYDTEGYVRKDIALIEFCTKNKKLAQQLQGLLLRFGIISKLKNKKSCATNTKNKIMREYYYLYISGFENIKKFYLNIPIRCDHKVKILKEAVNRDIIPNTNIDILPQETNKYIKELSILLGIKIKPNKKRYPLLGAYIDDRCSPSREGVKRLLKFFENKLLTLVAYYVGLSNEQTGLVSYMDALNLSSCEVSKNIGLHQNIIREQWANQQFKARPKNLENFYQLIKNKFLERVLRIEELMTLLYNLSNSDIFWDKIISIELSEKPDYVYDLMIENNHNFIANNLFVHNSNVVDALCFVLGKSSAKEMRAEKSANLIFNGGKKSQPAKEAEVEIYFDNSNNHFPLDAREIKVSRVVRSNGLSKYRINNETRTRQQVLELLNSGRIDPDGHNIVLQGDIIGFTDMKNEDRRKIIEEISGISVYEERKEKAMSELGKVQGKLSEANIILTEREAYLRELKTDRDKALKYREVEDEIKSMKATMMHMQIKEKEEKKLSAESELNRLNNELSSVNSRISEIKNAINEKKEEVKRINEEIDQKGEIEQKKLQIEIEKFKIEIVKLTNRKEVCENEIVKIRDRKESLEKNLKEIDAKINELSKNKNELLKKQSNLAGNEKKLLDDIQKFKEKHKLTDAENLDTIENEVDSKQKTLEELQFKRQELQRENAPLEFELNNLDERIKKSSQDGSSNIKDLRNGFKKHTLDLSKLINENSSISAQLAKYRRELMEKDQELERLRIKDSSIKDFIGEDLATKRVLDLKEGGVHGTVSSLGNVSSKYSGALEVAGGPRIKSIVVETDALAAKCISMLKEQRLGVVTFLPLNKLKPRIDRPELKELLKNKGVIDLAVNLVNFDKRFNNVFSYVFGDTVIIDNVETARRIGIGRARMVTLDGDLMEVSGSMTGGFRRKTGLGFREKEVSEGIRRIEEEVSRLRSVVDDLDKRKIESEDLIYNIRQKKAEIEAEIIKLEKLEGVEDVEKLKQRRNELNEQANNIISRLRDNENIITGVNKEINKLKELRHSLRERTKDIHLNEELEKLELERQGIKEEVLAIDSGIKNIDLQINNMLMQEKERTLKIIKDHEKEREDFTNETKTIVEKVQQLKASLKENESKSSQFYSDYKKLFNLRNRLSAEMQQKETLIVRDEERIKGIEYRLNSSSLDKAKIISEIEGLMKEAEEFADAKLKRGLSLDELRNEAKKFESELKDFGNVNLRALEIYEKVSEEYKALVEKLDKLKLEKEDVLNLMAEIDGKKKEMFMKTYDVIDENFKRIFASLSTKGEAHLDLEDPETVFNGGLDIKVRLNSTKFLDIKSLSGGEKSLTALAFIFAIQEFQPASFYLLDEVDAALDRNNSELLSRLIKKYSEKAQYIVISHNDAVINDADYIYGVSMQDEVSKVVSLKI